MKLLKEILKLFLWTVFVSPVVMGVFIVWCLCWIVTGKQE